MLKPFSDQEIAAGLLAQDSKVLNYLYSEFYPIVLNMIGNNKDEEMAKDIFQDGMIAIYSNLKDGKYIVSKNAKLRTYFLQVCKFKWYDILKSSSYKKTTSLDTDFDYADEIDEDDTFEKVEQQKKIHKLFDQLGEKCKKILKLYYWEKLKMNDIAERLSMKTDSVKNGKYRCIQQLKDMAKNSSNLKIIK
ncbi:MAG: sigma-70 family RNA polymerase sigma factor [Saprospiraceae bacterium]|nr:sigma-70 family RNA polymerase sigma factor [Bacteroidia bacterium]NNL91890.1 sigma-70 family RNA polymerase sigma factor [Saprospiraceae bacterium]